MYASLSHYLGTKNVARELKKGRVRDRNTTWFPELTDKRKWIDFEVVAEMSVHLGAMKNCGGDPNVPMALNIPNHYKVNVIARTGWSF